MKTIIGVGILSLPFIFSTMGIIPTIVMFVLAGLLTHFTALLLLKSKNLSGHSNFSSIMHHLHHHKAFKIIVSLALMSGNFGACIHHYM
jgi:amino acid permease